MLRSRGRWACRQGVRAVRTAGRAVWQVSTHQGAQPLPTTCQAPSPAALARRRPLLPPAAHLDVAGDDARLLVVAGGVARQLQHLGSQVLQHRCQVDGGPRANALQDRGRAGRGRAGQPGGRAARPWVHAREGRRGLEGDSIWSSGRGPT